MDEAKKEQTIKEHHQVAVGEEAIQMGPGNELFAMLNKVDHYLNIGEQEEKFCAKMYTIKIEFRYSQLLLLNYQSRVEIGEKFSNW